MLPIRVIPFRATSRLAAWALAVFLAGAARGRVEAKPLPPNGVEEFRALLLQDRSLSADEASAASALVERRRELRKAADQLPSLGEVTRVLLLPEWSSAEFDEFDSPVPLEKVEAAARQRGDEEFQRDVQKLLKMGGEDPSRVVGAISAQLKRDLRQLLLERLEKRLRFYLGSSRTTDRIAAANLVSDTMGNARRQDNQEPVSGSGEQRGSSSNSLYLRQRLRNLAGDLQKLTREADAQVQVASVRALSNLEGDVAATVSNLQPLLTSRQNSLTARRAAATAFAHMVDIVYQRIQADKSRPQPPLRSLERIFPAAASGLGDTDPEVRRSCLEACQEAATALDELVGDRNVSLENMAVYRPLLRAVAKSVPDLNLGARDSVPELRVAACHLLETLALITQKVRRLDETPLLPPRPEPIKPDKKSGKDVKKSSRPPARGARRPASQPSQWAVGRSRESSGTEARVPVGSRDLQPQTGTILLTPVPLREAATAPAVTLERPVKLPVIRQTSLSRSPARGVQPVAFLARQIDELPPPKPLELEASLRETVNAMIAGLSDPDYRVRLASVDVLETFGERAVPAIPAMVKALGDTNKFVRWSAARTLGRLAEPATERDQAEKVVAGLMRLLNDREDLSVRITAASSIEQYGPAAKEAVPLLARVINRGDKDFIIAVLRALQGIGTDAQPALPNVAWILRSREQPSSVRVEAARTLGRFGALAKGQLRGLREIMVSDPDEAVRDAASSAVLAIDRPK
jgi:HEAT repeat protein